jgi:hypothetical protein
MPPVYGRFLGLWAYAPIPIDRLSDVVGWMVAPALAREWAAGRAVVGRASAHRTGPLCSSCDPVGASESHHVIGPDKRRASAPARQRGHGGEADASGARSGGHLAATTPAVRGCPWASRALDGRLARSLGDAVRSRCVWAQDRPPPACAVSDLSPSGVRSSWSRGNARPGTPEDAWSAPRTTEPQGDHRRSGRALPGAFTG